MFGRLPGKRIPEIRLGEGAVEHLPVEAKKYVTQLIEKLDEMQEIAGTNQGGELWKKKGEEEVESFDFEKGSLVLLERKGSRPHKLAPLYQGPVRVVERR
ncbi:hypothetical protein ADUPG1_003522, partial [Aduncisulcus paluster]